MFQLEGKCREIYLFEVIFLITIISKELDVVLKIYLSDFHSDYLGSSPTIYMVKPFFLPSHVLFPLSFIFFNPPFSF